MDNNDGVSSTTNERRRQTLEHLSARHQQKLKQLKQENKNFEINEESDAQTNQETKTDLPDSSCFLVNFKGQILGCNFQSVDHIYCRYNYVYGTDWDLINGNLDGFSQIAVKNKLSFNQLHINNFNFDSKDLFMNNNLDFIWNLPIDLTLSSSNVFGWPQIAISVYGLNFFGVDIIRGYGHTHIPPIPGKHKLSIDLFCPKSSTLLGEINCYLGGKKPEFLDFKSVAEGQGRDVLRFESVKGKVIIEVNVIIKDLLKHGFTYN